VAGAVMAKRELSSTIKNLKFMQRARQKEELVKKEVEVIAPTSGNRKCVVIMEGDPTPGAVIGRMSFQNCNPSIDKLKDEAEDSDKHRIPSTSTADRNGMDIDRLSIRENGVYMSHDRNGGIKQNRENDDSEDLQRKKLKVEAEADADADAQSSYLSPTNSMTNNEGRSSTSRGRKTNQQGRGKLDWRLLRPPSGRTR
jgi:M-phase phosphoprotein-6